VGLQDSLNKKTDKTNERDLWRGLWLSISDMMILYDRALETHKGPPYIFNDSALEGNKIVLSFMTN